LSVFIYKFFKIAGGLRRTSLPLICIYEQGERLSFSAELRKFGYKKKKRKGSTDDQIVQLPVRYKLSSRKLDKTDKLDLALSGVCYNLERNNLNN
jgi:hypothetical protein